MTAVPCKIPCVPYPDVNYVQEVMRNTFTTRLQWLVLMVRRSLNLDTVLRNLAARDAAVTSCHVNIPFVEY